MKIVKPKPFGLEILYCLPFSFIRLCFTALFVFVTACSHQPHNGLSQSPTGYSQYPDGGSLYVSATFGRNGRLWRVVPQQQKVYVDYSDDLGKSFSTPVLINLETQKIKISGENRPEIAVDNSGDIYLIYSAEDVQPVTVFYSVSKDNGRSFSQPKPLSEKAAEANTFQGRLGVDRNGKLYAFWHDERTRTDWQQLGNAIFYNSLNGKTGLSPVSEKLSDTLCDCCRIAVAFDNQNQLILLTRFIYSGGVRDHGLVKLPVGTNSPQTLRATYDDWIIEACPEHGPAISIGNSDKYHIAWFTQGNARKGLFYANSSDGGQHFSQPLAIGMPGKLPSHPDILALNNHVVLAWTEFDGEHSQLFVQYSHDNGETWSAAKLVARFASQADYPFLLNNGKSLFVSWNSKTEGYRLIPLD